ncbi:bifunctional adenosylcobinamide kinase/adenosylcobinamide-phosphate guanylyltransferase [Bacterioplanoides sp.]|uniref:bifunctional adenosylcobinamide kinase/adenosylcobinamide-phosphate guanylyltransferase n=1 Tax=Bacterioplanoides sp. TaxID=2066072 RepID=UPI003AFFC606
MSAVELILGGARSGKSHYGEQQMLQVQQNSGVEVVYIATAENRDGEMQQRIKKHQQQRPDHWQTIEEPLDLASCLKNLQNQSPSAAIMVDCLTLWLTNCLLYPDSDFWPEQKLAFLKQLEQMQQPLVLISNEVGQGIVPMGELSRRFVDEAGWLHQAIARRVDHVTLVSAGLPLALKRHGQAVYPAVDLVN